MNRQLLWSILSICAFFLTLVLNYLSTSGVFNNTDQQELSAKYELPITPPGWVFAIWGLIYFWQLAWQIMLIYDSIKFSSEIKRKDILVFGVLFYVGWIASDLFNGSWVIVFSFEYLSIALVLLVGITASLYVAAFKAHKYLYNKDLKEFENVSDDSQQTRYPLYLLRSPCRVAFYRILVLNGISFYLTWTNIATCLNIGIVLCYVADMSAYAASNVALAILFVIVVTYILCDFWALREYLVFTYSPFFILFWALGGILTNDTLKDANRSLVLALLILCGVYFPVKIGLGIAYAIKQKKMKQIRIFGDDEKPDYSLMQEKV